MALEKFRSRMIPPEKTAARVPFGNPPNAPTFEKAKVVVYGVPFDDTATFGKGSDRGPEALRHSSARQIETFVVDEKIDLYKKVPIFDLGDFRVESKLTPEERATLQDEQASAAERERVIKKLDGALQQFDALRGLTEELRKRDKIPLMIGGEHTLTYWTLAGVAREKPVVIHFDAHRDAKAEYRGMRLSHTTPMYHHLKEHGGGPDFIQIGIRQTDAEEQAFMERSGVVTFYPADVRRGLAKVKSFISRKTRGRAVYVTFDIDALDIAYTPCTGTPEPFGLTPEEAVEIFRAIHSSARLVGADMMEVAIKNGDHREGTTAVQLLLRLLARPCVR